MMSISTESEKRPAILLADHDINWGQFLLAYLEHKGFDVHWQTDGMAAWQCLEQEHIDFCILSPALPVTDGLTLAHHIRERAQYPPIMFVAQSAYDSESTRIACFKAGADDFIALPCALEEILLRIKTIRKRFRFCPIEADKSIFDLGVLQFDYNQQKLYNQDTLIHLTTKESELLKVLCAHQGKVLERDQALLAVWKSTAIYNVRSMDVYISKLRRLLFQYTYSEIINIHGVGFKLITHRDARFRNVTPRDRRTIRYRQTLKHEPLGMNQGAIEVKPEETGTKPEVSGEIVLKAEITTDKIEAAGGQVPAVTDLADGKTAGQAQTAMGTTTEAAGLAATIISAAAEMTPGQMAVAAEAAIEEIGIPSMPTPSRDAAPPDGHTAPACQTS